MVVPQRLTFDSPAMNIEVTHTVPPKPKDLKKITYADEIGPQPIATTATSSQKSNGKAGKKSYEQMIIDAIAENDPRRKGISFTLIKKFIKGKYQIDGEITLYVKKAFEKLTSKDAVERVSGKGGMSGSIRLTKAHVESVKKQEKLAEKPKPKKPQQTKKPPKIQPKKNDTKDTNNNDKEKGKATKAKPKPHVKLSTKALKTSITKTKIAKSGGKVRLSIVTGMDPSSSTSAKTATKAKMSASKTITAKSAKTKGQKSVTAKPKPVQSDKK